MLDKLKTSNYNNKCSKELQKGQVGIMEDFNELRVEDALSRIAMFLEYDMLTLARNTIDALYTRSLIGEVSLTEEQSKYMFFLLRKIGK